MDKACTALRVKYYLKQPTRLARTDNDAILLRFDNAAMNHSDTKRVGLRLSRVVTMPLKPFCLRILEGFFGGIGSSLSLSVFCLHGV